MTCILHLLPPEILREIIHNTDYSNIRNLCNTSKYIRFLCHSKNTKNMLISKFMKDSLDTYDFTEDELKLYEKVQPLKRKMCLTNYLQNQISLNISFNNLLFTLKDNKLQFEESNINRIVTKIFIPKDTEDTVILCNDGTIIENEKIIDIDNIINIESFSHRKLNTIIITSKKESYIWNNKLIKHTSQFNVVQRFENCCLTDNGEVYMQYIVEDFVPQDLMISDNIQPDAFGEASYGTFKFPINYYKVHGLPCIIQISPSSHFLSEDGDIWKLNYDNLTVTRSDKYTNIIQIYPMKNDYYLDNKGNIFTPVSKIETFKNLIEIAIGSDESNIYALDGDMKLYIYNISGELLHSYDLLQF